jgi:hypothetical protein
LYVEERNLNRFCEENQKKALMAYQVARGLLMTFTE